MTLPAGRAAAARAPVVVLALPALAQQTPKGDPLAIVIPVAALIIVVVGTGLLIMHLRGRMLRRPTDSASTGSWLDELRAMHRRGEVSDEEFEAARASLLAKISGAPVPRRPAGSDPTLRAARPGFDLTGAPLPKAARPSDDSPDSSPRES